MLILSQFVRGIRYHPTVFLLWIFLAGLFLASPLSAQSVTITTTALPGGTVGIAYSQPVVSTGGAAPLTWSLVASTLPSGLSLDSSTGIIAGTPTAAGLTNFTVQVADNMGAMNTKALSITIAAVPSITTASLPGGTVNAAYSQTVTATGGTTPLTWSLSSGTLPSGLNPITSGGGVISGTPSASGTFNFTVLVTDAVGATATQALSIVVAPALSITTTSLPGGTVSTAYSQTVVATGGTAPLTWSLSAGTLPAGLGPITSGGGVISGAPSAGGTSNFTVLVTDAVGATATKALSIVVASALSITTSSLPGGTVGASYSQTVTASGGTTPLTWSLSAGTLPSGLGPITSGGGVISGTPSAAGTFNFTVLVTDAVGATATKALSIVIASAPSITTASLPGGTVSASYSHTVTASGGTAPLTWSLSAGTLPAGLGPITSGGGVISGTPSAGGTFNFTVLVTDAVGATTTKALSIVVASALSITTSSLPGGTVSAGYSQTVTATGGTTPLTWSLSAGTLPAGLGPITSGGGVISGTPSAGGTSNFTVLVTDAVGATATKALSIVVASALSITTSSLPGGTVGASYSQTVTAGGGTTPLTWSLSAGTLPAGLGPITSGGGVISGTPSAAGTFNFTVLVTDAVGATATKALSIVIASAPNITTASLPGGTVSASYSQTVTASGGTAPLTWSLSAGALPAGLGPITSGGGVISGTPSSGGTSNFTVLVTDAAGATATKALSITIAAGLSITTSSLPGDTIGIAYSQTVTASGGTAPLTWSLSAGALPAGISPITSGGGVISGTPTSNGTSNFTVLVTDAVGATATKALSIVVASLPNITTASLPGGTVGAAYSQTVAATGGTAPLVWSLSAGTLPAGLGPITSGGGVISGTPSVAGTSNFTVLVTDAVGATATKALSIVVASALNITTASLPGGTVGASYSQTVTATGGTAPLTWSLSAGALPTGINPITSGGVISGTPSAGGTFNFTVRVTDAVGATTTKALSIVIASGLSITTTSLPGGTVGAAYTQTVSASGGTAPLTWSLSAGALPAGLGPITGGGGVISGTPSSGGTSNFTVLVTDAVGATATKALSIVVASALSITTSSLPGGTVGAAYSQTVSASGGTAPLSWSLSAGALPAGLGPITSGGGVISGTPSSGGTSNFTVLVTDAAGATATKALSIVVASALSITTSSLPGGTIGAAYSQTVTASGGTAPLAWSLSAGTLPAGLGSITSGGGVISGTPTSAGTFNFTVLVTDAVGATATKALSILVASALSISTSSLPGGTVGAGYSQTVVAAGGTAPLTWSLSAGALPAGLNPITSGGGVISGTPSSAGTFNFTVLVTDAVGATATKALSIVVASALSISTSSLPGGTVSTAYGQTVVAAGGTAPLTWSVTAGALPAGLSFNTGTGAITGTPTAAGTANFTIHVSDSAGAGASQALSITIAGALTITTVSLPGGTLSAAYSQTATSGGGSAPLTWSVTAGALPAGLSLSSGGAITGTPTAVGTANFTLHVSDSVGAGASQALSITIAAALTITTASLPGGTLNTLYSQTAASSGGTAPLTWSLSAGAFPAGISISSGSGAITGIPTVAGTANFTIQVADAAGATATKALSIPIAAALTITTATLPGGTLSTAYSQTVASSGGTAPLTWSVTVGALPAGLSLNTGTGAITGTPSAAGTSNFTIHVADSAGAGASQSLSITVAAALAISTASLPGGTLSAAYSQTVVATGGTAPRTWSVTVGALPAGLTLNTGTGAITGTPTSAGTANFTIQVADAAGATAAKALSIQIAAALTISTVSLPGGTLSTAYSQAVATTGGTTPLTWSVTAGALPAGLTLNTGTGAITGSPTTPAGTANFTVQVADAAGATVSKALSIVISVLPSITTTTIPGGTVGAVYSQTVAVTGGTAPLTWSVTLGALPGGLTLTAGTGAIAGTPTAAGTSNFTIQVVDAAGASVSKAFSITIAGALAITTNALPGATVGAVYSQTVATSGGTAPLTWSITAGALPAVLSLNTGTGAITGTPTIAGVGTANVTLRVTDAAGGTATKAFSIVVAAALVITTDALPGGTVGAVYSQTAAATGGTLPLTWSILAGALPAGVTLNAGTGLITGTIATAGTSNFALHVTDSAGAAATQLLSITVATALSITTTSVPGGTVGAVYSRTITAAGGTAPLVWSISLGTLPPGLTLNTSTGVISGTPTMAGTSNFTVHVADAASAGASLALTIPISAALAITTTTLPGGTLGIAYSQTVIATGGTAPLAWSVTVGTLPLGLSLDAATGTITGTPTTAGLASFTLHVGDAAAAGASQDLTIPIAAALVITSTTLPGGTLGTAYSQAPVTTGGTAPLAWSITVGTLPAGLSIDNTTGLITGTPTIVGTTGFTVQVADAAGAMTSKALAITIAQSIVITTNTLPDGSTGRVYASTLALTGGTGPFAWTVLTGTLPAGLNLNPATGQIGGTPTLAGAAAFTVQVTDNAGATASKPLAIQITLPLSITTAVLQGGTTGIAYVQSLVAAGGAPPYSNWTVITGSLPAGLSLNPATGDISGTPTTIGTANFTVQVTDAGNPTRTASAALSIAVALPLTISTTVLPRGHVGASYTATLVAAGGTAPYTWAVTQGTLPTDLSLDASTGVISGTPTLAENPSFVVQVSDSGNPTRKIIQPLSIAIATPLLITTSSLQSGSVGSSYTQILTATGDTPPYTWSVVAGSLPAGLLLVSSTGAITGLPLLEGLSQFTIQVADSSIPVHTLATRAFTIKIDPSQVGGTPTPVITNPSLSNGTVGTDYAQALGVTGGTAPYVLSIAAGALPTGLTLSLTSGVISGTPTQAGTFSFTVQVTDSSMPAQTTSKVLAITIIPGITITTATLPGGDAGTAYSASMAASGGTTPYVWSISTGSLPGGLTLNSTTGAISGTLGAAGSFDIRIKVTDANALATSKMFTIVVAFPKITLSVPATSQPTQQTPLGLTLQEPYPSALSGQITLTFTPNAVVPVDDPMLQFSNGSRTASFTIAANSTTAVFSPSVLLLAGTVAGTMNLTASFTDGPQNLPAGSSDIAPAAPQITASSATLSSAGVTVKITGFAVTRSVTGVTFGFDVRTGTSLQRVNLSRNVDGDFGAWYQNTQSTAYGSAFIFSQLFTIQGDASTLDAVFVTLSNGQGSVTSARIPISRQ